MTNLLRQNASMPSGPTIRLRRRLPLLWLALLLGAALLLPDPVWTSLLLGMGGLVVLAYLWARALANGLRGRRQLHFRWVAVGDRLSETFELVNGSALPALWVEVVDHSNVPGYQAAVVRSLAASGRDRWRQAAVCERRGQFHLGPWSLHASDPFGIFSVTIPYPTQKEIIIHPPIHHDIPIPLPSGQSSGRARARDRSLQATINAATVREYQHADPRNWIHWPTSAHWDQLHVRQFDLDQAGDVWLLLDLQAAAQLGRGAQGTEEHMILLAAALLAQAQRQQRAVGLAAYGQSPQLVLPGRGQGHRWRVLRALALTTADGELSLRRSLQDFNRTVRRGSAVLILSPTNQSDWLPQLLNLDQKGVRCSVALLNRISFEATAQDNAPLRQAIRRLGFTTHLISQGQVGRPLQESQGRGFWEFKVTRTGKVFTIRSPRDDR
ncbi:MAG: DUF58 domain-containing protein [Candidatus Promineifilaceae bacterium]|nr:DUF58 domain-containing protein [Candidatus Promineifilaceae bacterium]